MKRFISLLFINVFVIGFFVMPTFVAGSKKVEVPVKVTASPAKLDVSIPTTFEISVSESGGIAGPTTSLRIVNNSLIPIKITDVKYTAPLNGWRLVSNSQVSSTPNIKEYCAWLNGIGPDSIDKDLYTGLGELKNRIIPAAENQLISLSYKKKSPLQTKPSKQESGGIFTFIFSF